MNKEKLEKVAAGTPLNIAAPDNIPKTEDNTVQLSFKYKKYKVAVQVPGELFGFDKEPGGDFD
jgi:hypothetical protein